MRLFANLALALSLSISFAAPSLGHAHQARRHHVHRQSDLSRRDPGKVILYERDNLARLTYYATGLGACGQYNAPTDFIVALDAAQYTTALCYQWITITVNGLSANAQIMDECPGCPSGGLDLSEGLFQFFADLSVGVLYGTWEYASGGSSPSPSPSPSPTPPPPSSSSVDNPLTTSLPSPTSWQPSPTTTPLPSLSSTASTLNSTAINSSTLGLASPQTTANAVVVTAGTLPGGATNSSTLFEVNMAMVYIGQFLGTCDGLW